ncbi:MAG: DUF5107 domain-containing protein, partial [Limisphaerales bacterium]
QEDFFGGYDYFAQAGIVHIANHHISPGKKQWTWGNHEFGYAWDRNLTDKDSNGEFAPYIEIMAGVYTDNQPDFSFLQPGETKTWSQFWYPIQKIGAVQRANLQAAVSLKIENEKVRIGVSVTEKSPDVRIKIFAKNNLIKEFTCNLAPGEPLIEEIKPPKSIAETDLKILVHDQIGNEIISYQPKSRVKNKVPPPATEPPPPEKISSTDELFITGLHLEQYRHATRSPVIYWREALRRDPLDSRCNNALGLWHLKRGEFIEAEKCFHIAIERLTRRNGNPYDGEAFYNLGLCLRFQADGLENRQSATGNRQFDEAYASFYKATWNQAWCAAGFHALAEMDCARKNWSTALEHLNRSLRFDTDNLRARNLKVIVLRKLNRSDEADEILRETLKLDLLDFWSRNLNGEKLNCDLQTQLDLAHDFARAGFFEEAIELLKNGGRARLGRNSTRLASKFSRNEQSYQIEHSSREEVDARARQPTAGAAVLPDQSSGARPMIFYTLGWLYGKIGDQKSALKFYRRAAAQSPDYCFPSRLEEIAVLESAMRANPRDAKAPYYLGNLFYDRRRHEETIRLWRKSAKLDPKFSIVWRNLGIGCFNILKKPANTKAAYEKAFRANPNDARLFYERDQLWKRLGEKPERRLRALEKFPQLISQRDDLSVELCALYNQTGQSEKAVKILAERKFQPWEGGEGGALGQHVRAQLALGRAALRKAEGGKRKAEIEAAVAYFKNALTSPRHLGEAKHLLANQSDIHFWLGGALDLLGDKKSARAHWLAAANFKGDFQEMSVRAFSEMTYCSALAWEKLGQKSKAKKLFHELLAYAQKLKKAPAKIDYFATSLPTMLLFDDDLRFRQETTASFLQAQANLGLGKKAKAKSLLQTVLKRDPSHALAADFLDGMAA